MAMGDANTQSDRTAPAPETSRMTRLWDHLIALRVNTVKGALGEIARIVRFAWSSLFNQFLATVVLGVMAQTLSIMALAGTIKIAAIVLFDWTRALRIGHFFGLDVDGFTKSEVVWVCAGVIFLLYLMAGTVNFVSKRSQAALQDRAEYVLYDRFLSHPSLEQLLQVANIQLVASRSIVAYAKSCFHLARAITLSAMCLVIIVVLGLFLPLMIVIVLVAVLPILLLYTLSGRRASVATKGVRSIETRRSETLKQLTPRRNSKSVDRAGLREEFLRLTNDLARERMGLKAAQSVPEVALSVVAGTVLAAAILIFSGMQTDPERLIYLLIGFILVRFLFNYLRNGLNNVQALIQNLDGIRYVNRTILSDVISGNAAPPVLTPEAQSDDLNDIA